MNELSIAYVNIVDLKPRPNNPRTHSEAQLRQIQASIKRYSFLVPVLVDENLNIIAGHGRVEAGRRNGLEKVPTVCVSHLTPAQVREYVIADNKIAENAGWDRKLLALELEELNIVPAQSVALGFSDAELEALLAPLKLAKLSVGADDVPALNRSVPAVTRPGDLWLIGPHRLLCGDATKPESYRLLLEGEKADFVFIDPPYNVPIQGHVSGLGKAEHREFAMASGEMSEAEFRGFLGTVFANLAAFSVNGSIHYICMDWRHMADVLAGATPVYSELKNVCIWVKANGGMGSLYRSRHEMVFVYKNGTAPHINNVMLGKNGRNRDNVWQYAGQTSFGANRDSELAMHPTVKPVALVADALLDCSNSSGLILDVFAGSGTTLVAAETVGRCCLGMEIDPYYCDTALKRLGAVLKDKPKLSGSGLTFDDVAAARASEGVAAA